MSACQEVEKEKGKRIDETRRIHDEEQRIKERRKKSNTNRRQVSAKQLEIFQLEVKLETAP